MHLLLRLCALHLLLRHIHEVCFHLLEVFDLTLELMVQLLYLALEGLTLFLFI